MNGGLLTLRFSVYAHARIPLLTASLGKRNVQCIDPLEKQRPATVVAASAGPEVNRQNE